MLGLKKKWERRLRKRLECKSLEEIYKELVTWLILFVLSMSMVAAAIIILDKMPQLEAIWRDVCAIVGVASTIAFFLIMLIVIPALTSSYNEVRRNQEENEAKKQVQEKLSETFKEVVYWPHAGDEVLMRCAKELKQTTIRHARIAADGVEILVLDNKGKVVNTYSIDATSFCLNYKIK